jgi:hypothetical protein
MQFERGKPPENPNAPYRAARIKDERWRSAGPGFEPGRAGPRLSLTSSQDKDVSRWKLLAHDRKRKRFWKKQDRCNCIIQAQTVSVEQLHSNEHESCTKRSVCVKHAVRLLLELLYDQI